MTPAARYIAGLYEHAIDADLNVTQVRDNLASRGVLRSAFQIEDDLDRVYSFAGYSVSRPAPEALSLAQIDRQFS